MGYSPCTFGYLGENVKKAEEKKLLIRQNKQVMINFKRKKEEKNLIQSSAGNKPNKGFAEKKSSLPSAEAEIWLGNSSRIR